jgi:hypothetical protein
MVAADYEKWNLAVGTEGGVGAATGSPFKPIILAGPEGVPDKVYDALAKKIFPNANAGDDWEVGNYADAGWATELDRRHTEVVQHRTR